MGKRKQRSFCNWQKISIKFNTLFVRLELRYEKDRYHLNSPLILILCLVTSFIFENPSSSNHFFISFSSKLQLYSGLSASNHPCTVPPILCTFSSQSFNC